jgi:hypothetical protein
MHGSFKGREDLIKQLVDKCHEGGMDVIAYYSLIYNNWAYKNHPDWQMKDINGQGSRGDGGRYGLCCPNNEGYRDFLKVQIKELCDYFDFEGIFLDMTFWPMVCYCDSCKKKWEKEAGGQMPTVIDWKDPRWVLFQKKRIEWLGEFAQFATGEVKTHKNDCTVEHQYSTALHNWRFGVTENITEASDYAGGDLYGGIAEQSFACKVYYNLTKNQPFEYMTSRCYTSLAEHTTNKSMDLLTLSVMVTSLHHGASLIIDAIDPIGTIDNRVYKKIGKIFREAGAFEPYLSMGDHSYDVGLYFNMFDRMDFHNNGVPVNNADKTFAQPHLEALKEAANALRSNHIAYSVLNNWNLELLQKAKVIVLSDDPFLSEREIDAIKAYVKNGGSVYISGRTNPELVEEIFNVKYEGFTEHKVTYISPTEEGLSVFKGEFTKQYPLAMFEGQPLYSGKPSGKVLATVTLPYTVPKDLDAEPFRFASIHSNPPGVYTDKCAMIASDYGKGKAFYSTLPIERAKREQHSAIFAGIMQSLMIGKEPVFSSGDAPETVEFILFDDMTRNARLLGLVNIQETFKTIPVNNFSVTIDSARAPKEVLLLPDKKPFSYEYENGKVIIHIDTLRIYMMLLIQY